jgi:hypothetical protein
MLDPIVWVAIVSTVGLLVNTLIANRTRQHARAARTQVENNHFDANGNPINLREEQDERHDENRRTNNENSRMIRLLLNVTTGTSSDIRGLRRDLGRLDDRLILVKRELREVFERVEDIEDTQEGTRHDTKHDDD